MSRSKIFRIEWSVFIIISLALLVAVFWGLVTAIFSPGFVVRALLPFVALGVLAIAWGYRGEGGGRFWHLLQVLLFILICISVLWPRYLFIHKFGLPGINPYTLGCMAMLSGCVFFMVVDSTVFSKVTSQWKAYGSIRYVILIFFGWKFLSSIIGDFPIPSVVELLKEFVYINCFLIFGLYISADDKGPIYLLRVLVFSGAVVALIGIYESLVQSNPFVGFISLDGDQSSARALLGIATEKARGGVFRAQSTFGHPIVFSQFIAATIPLCIFLLFHEKRMLWRTLGLVTIPLLILAVVKTGSRSGYFSMAIAFLTIGFFWWIRAMSTRGASKIVAILVVPALVLFAASVWFVLSDMAVGRNQQEVSSTSTRLTMIRDGVAALADSPIWGFGHNMALSKAGVVNSAGIPTLDNYFLSISLDYGYFGLAVFSLIFVLISLKSIKFIVHSPGANGAFVTSCLSSIFALLITFAGLSISENMTMVWLLSCVASSVVAGVAIVNFED